MDPEHVLLPSLGKYSIYARRGLLKKTGLVCLSIGLVALLLFQLFWINSDSWAEREYLRRVYSFLCALENLNCRLPAWMEPRGFALEDPQADWSSDSVYVIRAVLRNKRNRPRAFPWMHLVFFDANGIVIGSGRFSPDQYLSSEVLDDRMDGERSYDILLEVQKPSHPVVRYEMRFVAAAS